MPTPNLDKHLSIGINSLYLIPGGVGGTEVFLRHLLQALSEIDCENRYTVYANRECAEDICPAAPNFKLSALNVAAKNRPWRLISEQTSLVWGLWRDGIDVLLNPGYTGPFLTPCPAVTVFHDMQHKRHPEYARRRDLLFFRLLYWLSAHRASRIIAVSGATKEDMLRYYSVAPRKIRAIPHGVDERCFSLVRQNPPEKRILCVSTLHPHKGLDRLLRAFARWRRHAPDFKLCLVGLEGYFTEALRRIVRDLELEQAVDIKGWIAREEVYELYRTSAAFIYPSLFEGFGLPVLEALAAGLPTACSNIRPIREIVSDAATLFNPEVEDEIVSALDRITLDLDIRCHFAVAGPLRARRFSWNRTAKATLNLLRAAALRPKAS